VHAGSRYVCHCEVPLYFAGPWQSLATVLSRVSTALKGFPVLNSSDTICAVSTPLGMGGIGIVRMSGPGVVGVASKIFQPENTIVGIGYQSHHIMYGRVVNTDSKEVVDEALLSFMRAPKTYTREDVVEINCHGGPAAVRKVLELCVKAGARLAEPGEFTKRAFLNGRIDLTQAEAVMDLIAARTELSLAAAVNQLGGGLGGKVGLVREALAELLALTELSIDFSDEDIDMVPAATLKAKGEAALADIKALLATYDEGRVLRDGLRVAIVGRPNVGKSSLLNALARTERAIVTDIPGTTRDTVEELINLSGLPVRVIDTAGLRHSVDVVEKEGIKRSEAALREADLALVVLDGSVSLTLEDTALIEKMNDTAYIPVINKSDLARATREEGLKAVFNGKEAVYISAKTGAGLDELIARIKDSALGGGVERAPEFAINLRHKGALERAGDALLRFDAGCDAALSPELLALELRDALDAVGEVVGATTPEDVLDRIFRDFCIGK